MSARRPMSNTRAPLCAIARKNSVSSNGLSSSTQSSLQGTDRAGHWSAFAIVFALRSLVRFLRGNELQHAVLHVREHDLFAHVLLEVEAARQLEV